MSATRPELKLSQELIAFVHGGVALSIATRAELRPAFTRGWGPLVSEDGRTLTVCMMARLGSATRANLEETCPLRRRSLYAYLADALTAKVRGDPVPSLMGA